MAGSESTGSSDSPGGVTVRIDPPGEMHLLGYFLRSLSTRALEQHGGVPSSLKGMRYLVRCEGMDVTLSFDRDGVLVRRGRWPRIHATVRAAMPEFLDVLGTGAVVGATFRGAVGVRGKVWRLLPLMRFLRSGMTDRSREVGA